MADYDFNIVLGGSISAKTINTSISTIEPTINPIKIKAVLDDASLQLLRSQIQGIISKPFNINTNTSQTPQAVSGSPTNKPTATTSSAKPIVDSKDIDSVKVKYDELGNTVGEVINRISESGVKIQEVYKTAVDGSLNLKSSSSTTKTGLDEQIKATEKYSQTLASTKTNIAQANIDEQTRANILKEISHIESNSTASLNDKSKAILRVDSDMQKYSQTLASTKNHIEEANLSQKKYAELTQQVSNIEKNSSLSLDSKNAQLKKITKSLDSVGEASKKSAQSVSNMIGKFAQWYLIGGLVTGLTRGLKDVVKQTYALDTALTNIQMVTQGSAGSVETLKQSYIALAKEMKVTVDTVMSGADEFLRAGLNAKDTAMALRASIVLSTVANMDSATSTKYLIAQMNAYGLKASELMSLVDKMSAVDIVAATSSAELSEALSVSAKSAELAGIGYDKYLGILATVSETTRQSASSIGNSFKTIFARLQAVKIGSLVDEEGQDISDVSRLLKGYGIDLMQVTNGMSDMGALLDLIGSKWQGYTTAQKSEIATTVAGIRQREKFLVLMDKYDRSLELEQVSLNSAGSAMDKYGIYTESAEAKINALKASWTELVTKTLNSNALKTILDIAKGILDLSSKMGGLVNSISLLIGIVMGIKSTIKLIKALELVKSLKTATTATQGLGVAVKATSVAMSGLSLAISLATIVISAIVSGVNAYNQSLQDEYDASVKAQEQQQEEIDTLKNLKIEYQNLASLSTTTQSQKNRLAEISKTLSENYREEASSLDLLNGAYEENALAMRKQEKVELENAKTKAERTIASASDIILKKLDWATTAGGGIADPVQAYEAMQAEIDRRNAGGEYQIGKGTIAANRKWLAELEDEYNSIINARKELVRIDERINYLLSQQAGTVDNFMIPAQKFLNASTDEQLKTMGEVEDTIKNLETSEYYNQYKDDIDSVIKALREQITTLKTTDFAKLEMDKKLSILKKQQTIEQEELKTQEKLLAIEKAREELAKAKEQRIRVFRAGKGFVFEQDFSAVENAQKNLDKAEIDIGGDSTSQAIKEIEKLQELYDQAQLDQGELAEKAKTDLAEKKITQEEYDKQIAESEKLRTYFQDKNNLEVFAKLSAEEKEKFLNSFIVNKDWNKPMDKEDVANWLPKGVEAKHNNAFIGEVNSQRTNEPFLQLANSEFGTIKGMQNNVVKNFNNKQPESGDIINVNGAINLPNVQDVNGFISAMKRIGTNSLQTVTSRR